MISDDLALVRDWRNSDRVRPYMYTTHEITAQEHAAWWDRASRDERVRHYVFEVKDRPVGVVNIVDIDRVSGTASWGFYLGVDDAPPGCGSVMEYLALAEAFENLGIRKLNCEVLSFNERPLKLHARFGFEREGLRRAHKLHDGEFQDVVELALFADQWPQVAESLERVVFRG